jgi:DNA-binding response OmpR family regulator
MIDRPLSPLTLDTEHCFGSCPPRPALWDVRVLIINSDLSAANTILFELEASGAKGIVAEDFEQALPISESFYPDVLITKIEPLNLSLGNGLDKLKTLAVAQKHQPVFITVTDFPWIVDQTYDLITDSCHHLFDPSDCQTLACRIKHLLQNNHPLLTSTNSTRPMQRQQSLKPLTLV